MTKVTDAVYLTVAIGVLVGLIFLVSTSLRAPDRVEAEPPIFADPCGLDAVECP